MIPLKDIFIKAPIGHLIFLSVALLLFVFFSAIDLMNAREGKTPILPIFAAHAPVSEDGAGEEENPYETAENPFASLRLDARAVYVSDLHTGETLFTKNDSTRMPLASLAKLMTALTAEDTAESGGDVRIGPYAVAKEGDSGFSIGEHWRLSDLLKLVLVESSNDGAAAVAAAVGGGYFAGTSTETENDGAAFFIGAMNAKAREIGLADTYFLNETGLDIDENVVSGAYGSAKDMAKLLSHILEKHPDILYATTKPFVSLRSLENRGHVSENTNDRLASFPFILGSKTGYTALAGGNLVIAAQTGPASAVVIAVLGSTREGRFADAEKLYWAALRYPAYKDNLKNGN
ncbi:serine hydrolase [bacterium]|nr:serine hydrolase [bacterium]